VVGQPRPAELRQDRFRALNPAGLHVTFALLCRPELIRANYREIAAAARVALGTVGPVMKDLEARGFLRLKTGTERNLLDPERMLQEWVTHYPTTLRPKLNPRRFQADPEQIHQTKIKQHNAYWGGEVAAEKLTHFLKPTHFTIYAREPVAELVAASTILGLDRYGMPVSTTHILSSGVAGAAVANGSGLRARTLTQLAAAWLLTLPVAMLLSGGLYWLMLTITRAAGL